MRKLPGVRHWCYPQKITPVSDLAVVFGKKMMSKININK